MKYRSNSLSDTEELATQIAANFKDKGGIITLSGPLGSGKTTFTQSFTKSLGIKDKITSPTFIITRQYQIPNSDQILFHLDLYRLETSDDIKALSIEELFENPNNIILIEWPEKLISKLPPKAVQIKIEILDETLRQFSIDE